MSTQLDATRVQILVVGHARRRACGVERGAGFHELALRCRAALGPRAGRDRDEERCVRVDAGVGERSLLGGDRGFVSATASTRGLAPSLEQPRLGLDDVSVAPVDLVARRPPAHRPRSSPPPSRARRTRSSAAAEIDRRCGRASRSRSVCASQASASAIASGEGADESRVDRLHERTNLRPAARQIAGGPGARRKSRGDRGRPWLRFGRFQRPASARVRVERGRDAMAFEPARGVRRREIPPATSAQRLPVRAEVVAVEDRGGAQRQRERRQAVNRDDPAVDVDGAGRVRGARPHDGGHDLVRRRTAIGGAV